MEIVIVQKQKSISGRTRESTESMEEAAAGCCWCCYYYRYNRNNNSQLLLLLLLLLLLPPRLLLLLLLLQTLRWCYHYCHSLLLHKAQKCGEHQQFSKSRTSKNKHLKDCTQFVARKKNNRFLGKYLLMRSKHYNTIIHLTVELFFSGDCRATRNRPMENQRPEDSLWKSSCSNGMEPSETLGQYCWLKKFCTTWDVKNPVHNGMNYLSTGAGFLPSTVTMILQISSLGAQNVRRYTEIYRDVLRLAKKKMADKCIQMLGTSVTSMFSHHPAIKAPSCSINGLCSQPRDRSSVLKKKFACAGPVAFLFAAGQLPQCFFSRGETGSLLEIWKSQYRFISDAKWRFSIQVCRSI